MPPGGLSRDGWERTRSANDFKYSPDFRITYFGFRRVLPPVPGG